MLGVTRGAFHFGSGACLIIIAHVLCTGID